MLGQNESGSMSLEQLNDTGMNVVETICSIGCWPLEIILRPWHGTRYCSITVSFFSTMLMIALPVLSVLTGAVTQLIPGTQVPQPAGIFTIASFSKLYFLLSFIHGIRRFRLMIHLEKESLSEFEGPPLPFFKLLPGSASFWAMRILWEPFAVLLAATFLERMLIIQGGLAFYLQIAAFMLSVKSYISWFRAWQFLRQLLDAKFAGPIIARLIDGTATKDDLAVIHLTSFPENLSPDIRREAALHIARVISRNPEGK